MLHTALHAIGIVAGVFCSCGGVPVVTHLSMCCTPDVSVQVEDEDGFSSAGMHFEYLCKHLFSMQSLAANICT